MASSLLCALLGTSRLPLEPWQQAAAAGQDRAASARSPSEKRTKGPVGEGTAVKLVDQALGTSCDMRIILAASRHLYKPAGDEIRAVGKLHDRLKAMEKDPAAMCDGLRGFMDSLQGHLESKRGEDITAADEKLRFEQGIDRALRIQTAVAQAVELCVLMPVFPRVDLAVRKLCAAKDKSITAQRELLRGRPQTFFGIKASEASPNNWQAAVCELSIIESRPTAFERLHCLLDAARSIYAEFAATQNMKAWVEYEKERARPVQARWGAAAEPFKPRPCVLAADEFFPIFVYAVVNAEIQRPEAVKHSMLTLCAKGLLQGEGGYYLTVFEAAIEYIAGFDLKVHEQRQEDERRRKEAKKARMAAP